MYKSSAKFVGNIKAIDVNKLLPGNSYEHQKEFIIKKGTKIKLIDITDDTYTYEVK